MNYTPGPWEILPEEVDKDYIRGTQLGSRYEIANVITPTYPGIHEREAEETRANARLIAAAPELLEMLYKTVKVLERVGNDTLDGRNTAQDARNLINRIEETKMKAILTIGIPCSGKSTWAEKFCSENNYREINRDNLRMSLFNLERYNDYKMTKHKESLVTEEIYKLISECAEQKRDIVISDTNLNKKYRNILIDKLESLGYDVEIKIFDIEFFDALKRNEKRKDKQVPRTVMYDMYRRFMDFLEEQGLWTKHKHCTGLKHAYIVDIDGTISTNTGNRGFYEWKKVGIDSPIKQTIHIVNMLYAKGFSIILMSGRDSICRAETEDWLKRHDVKYDELYMRPEGSMEKDRYVKHQMYLDNVVNKYNINAVFDDRPQVSLLWHDLGIHLFKVGDPLLEF